MPRRIKKRKTWFEPCCGEGGRTQWVSSTSCVAFLWRRNMWPRFVLLSRCSVDRLVGGVGPCWLAPLLAESRCTDRSSARPSTDLPICRAEAFFFTYVFAFSSTPFFLFLFCFIQHKAFLSFFIRLPTLRKQCARQFPYSSRPRPQWKRPERDVGKRRRQEATQPTRAASTSKEISCQTSCSQRAALGEEACCCCRGRCDCGCFCTVVVVWRRRSCVGR